MKKLILAIITGLMFSAFADTGCLGKQWNDYFYFNESQMKDDSENIYNALKVDPASSKEFKFITENKYINNEKTDIIYFINKNKILTITYMIDSKNAKRTKQNSKLIYRGKTSPLVNVEADMAKGMMAGMAYMIEIGQTPVPDTILNHYDETECDPETAAIGIYDYNDDTRMYEFSFKGKTILSFVKKRNEI